MSTLQERLALARAAGAANRAAGVRVPSRAKAVRAYWREHFGLSDPQGGHISELRADYKAQIASLKGTSLKGHVQQTCFECVGGDDDPGPKLRVKRCACSDCPLHPVRPWQQIKGRAGVAA